jgi:voltage-gated potassium channel
MSETLHDRVSLLYTGRSRRATRFRYGMIAFDMATILYFIVTAAAEPRGPLLFADTVIGLLMLADFGARLWIATNWKTLLLRVYTLVDLVVIATLLVAPLFAHDLGLLRVLRGLRLIHSYHLLRDLRRDAPFFKKHEEAVLAGVNLFVFVFVTTSIVFVLRFGDEPGVASYIDALYFTVATLTTTGFGDITMTTPGGKLLSILMMIVGVSLFINLARALFQPAKVRHTCAGCGLYRHEPDAVHCKHCGR